MHALKQILGALQAQPGQFAQAHHHARAVLRVGVEAGARGRAANAQLAQAVCAARNALAVAAHSQRIAAKLLPHAHRHRILQMRAAGLQHIVKFSRLARQRVRQRSQHAQQFLQPPQAAQPDGRGNRVIGALRHVHMVVRAHQLVVALLSAQQFNCTVGEYLVHIHVVRRARPGLKRIHHKLRLQPACQHLCSRAADGAGNAPVQQPQRAVHISRRMLDGRHRPDKRAPRPQPAHRKVFHRAQRLNAVVALVRHLFLPQRVALNAMCHGIPLK